MLRYHITIHYRDNNFSGKLNFDEESHIAKQSFQLHIMGKLLKFHFFPLRRIQILLTFSVRKIKFDKYLLFPIALSYHVLYLVVYILFSFPFVTCFFTKFLLIVKIISGAVNLYGYLFMKQKHSESSRHVLQT